MKNSLALSFVLVLVFVFAANGFAQTDTPQPNQWKGLVLDQSTAEQVIKKFGKPKSDKIDKVVVPAASVLLTKELKQKKWRVVNYREIENAGNTLFVFDADNRLVIIHFELKELTPKAFIDAYGSSFKPVFSGLAQAFSPKDYARDAEGNVYAKSYPTDYYLLGASEKSFVIGGVINAASFGGVLKKAIGVPDSTLSYPGSVKMVELISRMLENKDYTGVLK